jgi:formyl-CoA transferase
MGNDGPAVEVVDMALFEGLFRLIPTQVAGYDQLGLVPVRPGNKLTSHGVLRNLYTTRDDRYFVVSAVGSVSIRRVMLAAGADGLAAEADGDAMTRDPQSVMDFLDRCDAALAAWAAEHDYEDVQGRMQEHDAVFQTVYSVADIAEDEQYAAREDLIRVPDDTLGEILMQGIVPKFASRAHRVTRAGPARGSDNAAVFGTRLGLSDADIAALARDGIV